MDMASLDLPRNLRALCSFQRSISEVCRRTSINRQQFNKYLSGATRPSAHNLRKICRFFQVEEYELLLPHAHFDQLLKARSYGAPRRPGGESLLALAEQVFPPCGPELERYEGYYHSHFHSLGWRGQLMRALIWIYQRDGRMCVKNVERFRDPRRRDRYVMKYDGLVSLMSNRLFIVEYERLMGGCITTTILNTTYRSHITLLTGITFGASTGRGRAPAAARVVYEYLGREIDQKAALAACGSYPEDSEEIEPEIRRLITNDISPDDKVLLSIEI